MQPDDWKETRPLRHRSAPRKKADDDPLQEHRGQDLMKLADQAGRGHQSWQLQARPNQHMAQYVEHMSKLLNTRSSINIGVEMVQYKQLLHHSLTFAMTLPVFLSTPTWMNKQLTQQHPGNGTSSHCQDVRTKVYSFIHSFLWKHKELNQLVLSVCSFQALAFCLSSWSSCPVSHLCDWAGLANVFHLCLVGSSSYV